MSKIRALVFPAGEINSLELHDALCGCVNVEVIGASSFDRHGPYVFANYYSGLPLISEPDFMAAFAKFVVERRIDLVFPTHDTVASFLAEHAGLISAKILGGDARACAICRDKLKTYQLFAHESFCPKLYEAGDPFPIFAKPRQGQGSVGARRVDNARQLASLDGEDMLVCEYLPGEEYTVDCLTDHAGRLRVVSPRSRLRVMAGISMAGRAEPLEPEILRMAETINAELNFLGLWWFQIKRDRNGQWKLLEISARCAGSMALTRARGINLPLLSVYAAMGREIAIEPNDYRASMDSALIRRFRLPINYDRVYIDFDDTVVVAGKVNLKAIWFLYQCRNQGKSLVLLTRHEQDIKDSLARHGIAENLFARIIGIDWSESKCDHIRPQGSILIDNSWHERHEAREKLGIPVFDVDGLDFLLDWVC